MQSLPAGAKAGIVAGGYTAALVLAYGVVSIYILRTSGPDRETYAGMYAFGDALLFLAVYGVVSTIPAGFAFVFLRHSRNVWVALSLVTLLVAVTSLVAIVVAFFVH